MKKRIVIHDRSTAIHTIFQVAINTPEGTLVDTNVQLTEVLQVLALVYGYLFLFHGDIEIHPRSQELWNVLRALV